MQSLINNQVEVSAKNTETIDAEHLTGQVNLPPFGQNAGRQEIKHIDNLVGAVYQPVLPGARERIAHLKKVFSQNTVYQARPNYLK